MSAPVLVERRDGKGIITLNRPEKLNALNRQILLMLGDAIDELLNDKSVRVIVVTGVGNKAFCAGADIGEQLDFDVMQGYEWTRLGNDVFEKFEDSPKPTIAAINGYCLGGGMELALACDIRICTDKAKLGTPESTLGLMCGFGGNLRLPRIVGKGIATELLMTGKKIDAAEAYRIGLVNRVVPVDAFAAAVDELCADLLDKGAIVLDFVKKDIDCGTEMQLENGKLLDSALFGVICSTYDKHEGMSAFLEKRKPVFKDR